MADTESSAVGREASARDQLLAFAKQGDARCLGQLLESYRNYLALLAGAKIDAKLKPRIAVSDLVQETMLGAYRDFEQFRGSTEGQLLAWMRQILIHRLHVYVQQHVLAAKRDVRREVALGPWRAALDRSSMHLQAGFADPGRSPLSAVVQREGRQQLSDLLAELPEDQQRVVILRNLHGKPFEEIGRSLNRSSGAVRMLWLRAIKQLRHRLAPNDQVADRIGSAPTAPQPSATNSAADSAAAKENDV